MCTEEPEARKLRRRRASFSKTLAAAGLLGVGIACSPAMPSNSNQSEKPRAASPHASPPTHAASPPENPRAVEPPPLPLADRLPTRTFREIKLPAGVEYQDFAGSGDHAWLLADERVYRHDGRKITKELLLCPGVAKRTSATRRYRLLETDRGVFAVSFDPDEERVIADFRSGESVTCLKPTRPPVYPLGALLLALVMRPKRFGVVLPDNTRPLLGLDVPTSFGGPPGAGFFRLAGDSVWLATTYELFRLDGTAWRRVADPPLAPLGDMWAEPRGNIWAILNYIPPGLPVFGGAFPGERHGALGKYDGTRWTLLPVPVWFQPDHIVGTAADDIWFTNGGEVHQWDGHDWHRQNFVLAAPWGNIIGSPYMDSKGSLWVLARGHHGWSIFRTEPRT